MTLPSSNAPHPAPPAFDAVILAAGASSRFFKSGGTMFKQVVPYKGVPIIRHLYDLLAGVPGIDQVHVVLGEQEDCAAAIRSVLPHEGVQFHINPDSARDNNLLSFRHGTETLSKGALVLEADCILGQNDFRKILANCGAEQICWANIGPIDSYDYGGVLETNSAGKVISVDVLSAAQMTAFKAAGRTGLKLFGAAAFGATALQVYRRQLAAKDDPYNQYFHTIATEAPGLFDLRTVEMSPGSFSFNVVSEFENA